MASTGMAADGASVDLALLVSKIWRRRWWLVLSMIVAALLSMIAVRLIAPAYTIELKVTPAASSDSVSSRMGQFGGLAAAAGITLDKSSGATPFELYLEMLRSRELAATLAADPRVMRTIFHNEWDSTTRRWHEHRSVFSGVKSTVMAIIGAPEQPWREPDSARLERYLDEEVLALRGTKDPITRILYDNADPAFGKYLLGRMNEISDNIVRMQNLDRARAYTRYLSAKLPTVMVLEQKQALTSILSDQEKSIMMASTPLPYAAVPVDTVNASEQPTRPNGLRLLIAFLGVGLVVGIVLALVDWGSLRQAMRGQS